MEFFLPGPPLPAPRPRFRVIKARSGQTFVSTYYDKKYKTFLEKAPVAIRREVTGLGSLMPVALKGPLSLHVHFYVERPKTTKRDIPRYDIDNYLKGIMDAITYAGIWLDDDQVAQVGAKKSWATDNPGVGVFVSVEQLP